jgi:hypothetical protein
MARIEFHVCSIVNNHSSSFEKRAKKGYATVTRRLRDAPKSRGVKLAPRWLRIGSRSFQTLGSVVSHNNGIRGSPMRWQCSTTIHVSISSTVQQRNEKDRAHTSNQREGEKKKRRGNKKSQEGIQKQQHGRDM